MAGTGYGGGGPGGSGYGGYGTASAPSGYGGFSSPSGPGAGGNAFGAPSGGNTGSTASGQGAPVTVVDPDAGLTPEEIAKKKADKEITSGKGYNPALISAAELQKKQADLADYYGAGSKQSMGENATDYMNLANKAASGQAAQSAQAGSTAAIRAALQAARSSGVNKGQSALVAGQQAGDVYSDQYQKGLESGRAQYQGATGQFNNQEGAANTNQINALNSRTNLIAGKQSADAAQKSANANMFGSAAGAAALMLPLFSSDKNLKKDIKVSDNIDDILAKVKPINYKYKESAGIDNQERPGVTAQSLEDSPLAASVVDTPEGKKINTTELTPMLLNMVIQLGQRLQELEAKK